MSASISLFASLEDYQPLRDYALSLGLQLVPLLQGDSLPEDPAQKPFCYLSCVPESQLRTYGKPPGYSYALDPLLLFQRPYFQEPYLVAGFIQWSTDSKAHAVVTRPYYQKLSRWVRREWNTAPDSIAHIGPAASVLLARGARLVQQLPTA